MAKKRSSFGKRDDVKGTSEVKGELKQAFQSSQIGLRYSMTTSEARLRRKQVQREHNTVQMKTTTKR